MSNFLQAAYIRIRRGTSALWSQYNPVLQDGEVAYDKDTNKLKVGDGVNNWGALKGVDTAITGGEILAKLAPVDGMGSGLDADTIHNLGPANFNRYYGASTNVQINDQGRASGIAYLVPATALAVGLPEVGFYVFHNSGTDVASQLAVGLNNSLYTRSYATGSGWTPWSSVSSSGGSGVDLETIGNYISARYVADSAGNLIANPAFSGNEDANLIAIGGHIANNYVVDSSGRLITKT